MTLVVSKRHVGLVTEGTEKVETILALAKKKTCFRLIFFLRQTKLFFLVRPTVTLSPSDCKSGAQRTNGRVGDITAYLYDDESRNVGC